MFSRNDRAFTWMVLPRAGSVLVGIACALASVACGDDESTPSSGSGGAAGTGGSSNGGSEDTCKVAVNASAEALSFKDDVMPIFGFACAGSACHSSNRPKADLFLGPKCDFKDGACTWPAEPNTANPTAGQPITQADIDRAHQQLLLPSATASAVKRVEPGDPDASFLIDKLAGVQNDKGLACTNQDPNVARSGECGDPMPAGRPMCETGASGQARLDTIVNWIAQGALNN